MENIQKYDDDYGSNKNTYKNKAVITDKSGNIIERIEVEPGRDYSRTPVYRKDDGTWTEDPLDVARYSIDSTGAIQLVAPKALYETPEFHQIFDQNVLKSYSAAYRSDPNFRVPYTQRNEDGTTEETQITIPEFVEKLNDGLSNFVENYKIAQKNKKTLVEKYGEKADNLTLTQLNIVASGNSGAKRVYLPDVVFQSSTPFDVLKNKRDKDGTVSIEDFKEVYNRNKLGQEDLAALMARIDGYAGAADWGEDTVEFDDGTSMKNTNSASEVAKALSLKNYILSTDPDAEWYQSFGDGLWTLTANAAEGVASVFLNTLSFVEGIATVGQGHAVMNVTEDMQEAFSAWNQERMLIQDSTATLATLGQIGGMIAGTVAESYLIGAAGKGISSAFEKAAASQNTLLLNIGPSAQAALTPETLAAIEGINNIGNIQRGAEFLLKALPIYQKVAIATNAYKTFMAAHEGINWATSFLLDTIHDAIVYDAVTLRHVVEGSSDQNVKDYWLGQFADNAEWWIGTGFAKTTFKLAGQTQVGQAANAELTKLLSNISVKIGDKKAAIKDYIAGGDLVRRLKEQRSAAEKAGDINKANQISKKIEQTQQNKVLREARRNLANLDLDFEGLHLTEESLDEYHKAVSNVKEVEVAIDRMNQNLAYKRQEMLGLTVDPSTGKLIYVNPELGGANAKATDVFSELSRLTTKYKLEVASGDLLGQDIIDYIVGSQELVIKQAIGEALGPNSVKALEDVEVIKANLADLRSKLPEEVLNYLDKPSVREAYTGFYAELNNYGIAKGVVDAETIRSYEANPIWATNGYMPIQKKVGSGGTYIPEDGKYANLIEQDIEHFSYGVERGQHYRDPEITRQYRINNMAKGEQSAQFMKAYSNLESATNITLVSGEESQRAKRYAESITQFNDAVEDISKGFGDSLDIDITRVKKRKPIKNKEIGEAERTAAIASLSLSDTTDILKQKNVFTGGNNSFIDIVTLDNYNTWYSGQTDQVKKFLSEQYEKLGAKSGNGFGLFARAYEEFGDDFEAGLQRAYLIGDKAFSKSSLLNRVMDHIANGDEAFTESFIKESEKAALKNVQGINVDDFVDSVDATIRNGLDDYIAVLLTDKAAAGAIRALDVDGNGGNLTAVYYALKYINGKGKKKAEQALLDELEAQLRTKGKGLKYEDVELLKKHTLLMFDDIAKSRLNDAANSLRTINPAAVNNEDIFSEVKALNDKIKGLDKDIKRKDASSSTVMYLDGEGRRVYAEVDPAFASLYNYRYRMDKTQANIFAKTNAAMSKLFRFGTTTMNLSAFGNQLFRDTGNALVVGGAWQTIKANADNLVEVFGDDIVEQIKRFDPTGYEMRQVEALAEQTGKTIQEAAVSRELTRGAAISPATTETTLYRTFMDQAYNRGNADSMLGNMQGKLQGFVNKIEDRADELMNGRRETYLRNRVYANNLDRAIKQGYNLEQARTFATFAMNNATTNFSRQIYHMQAIADSTPYFRAAINGTKSFWRMWSLDPVGITGRMMGGLILPTIFLTGASLGDPDNVEVYKNIPEYQKDENLIFVVQGQVISIPIPQEMANIVSPVRQFVEYLHGANESDFWELMMNDALGFSPVNLTGFSTIDMDKMIKDPTLVDRIDRGFARVFSQVAPVPLKSTYILATGTDPYTGKKLYDPSYSYWDDTTNSVQSMDYNQNAFAKWFAGLFGEETSPAVAEKIISGIFGSTGSNVLGQFVTLLEKGPEKAFTQTATDVIAQATKPYSVEVYNQADSVWNRAVRALTAEKNAILNSKEFKAIYSELAQTTDEDKRKKLIASGQNLVKDFQQKVADTATRLESVYNGTFDRKKFGAVIQLLNFGSDPIYQSGSQYSSNLAQESFYESKDVAIATMSALGVRGVNDMSIFGYLTTDANGNSVMKYSEPTAIMEMRNLWYGAEDFDIANMEAKLKTDGLKTSDMWDGYYKAKAQGKAALKQYKSDWNARVVKSLAPYISERGVNSVMKNSGTRDILDNYLFIDNLYQTKQYLYKIFGES